MRPDRSSGFTLMDVVIGFTITAVVSAGMTAFVSSAYSLTRITTAQARLDIDAARTMERVLSEITRAATSQISPVNVPFTTQLDYQTAEDWVNGAVVLSTPTTLQWQASLTDPVDGADNDGNGLVDDGTVVRRRDVGLPSERVEVLVTGVPALLEGEAGNLADDNGNGLSDEGGFCIDFTDGLTVHLTLQRVGPGGVILTRTLQSAVSPRNG